MKVKHLLAMVLCMCIVLFCVTPISTVIKPQVKLSSMSNEECLEFLIEHGVAIPKGIASIFDFKGLFADLEEDPDKKFFASGQMELIDFIDEVKPVVKEYYSPWGAVEVARPRVKLSSLSNDECIELLESQGVEVPYFFADAGGTAVKDVVMKYLENPNAINKAGAAVVSNFYDGVQRVVKKYASMGYRPKSYYAENLYAL